MKHTKRFRDFTLYLYIVTVSIIYMFPVAVSEYLDSECSSLSQLVVCNWYLMMSSAGTRWGIR